MSPGYEFRLPSYPSTAFPSLTTAHTGMIARDRTLGGIRMYTGTSTNWTHLGGEVANVKDPAFGAIGDGTSHPLSERFATLADAQVVYPHAIALTDEIDWAAIQGALNAIPANTFQLQVEFPRGRYRINRALTIGQNKWGFKLVGLGGKYRQFSDGSQQFGGAVLAAEPNIDLLTIDSVQNGSFVIDTLNFEEAARGQTSNLLKIIKANHFTLRDCTFQWGLTGIVVDASNDDASWGLFSNVQTFGCLTGIQTTSDNIVQTPSIVVVGGSTIVPASGIGIHIATRGHGSRFLGHKVDVASNGKGVLIDGAALFTQFLGCYVEVSETAGAGTGIELGPSARATCIIGGIVAHSLSTAGKGIVVNADDCVIQGVEVRGFTTGIEVGATAEKIKLTEINTVSNATGISILAGAINTIIIAHTSRSDTTAALSDSGTGTRWILDNSGHVNLATTVNGNVLRILGTTAGTQPIFNLETTGATSKVGFWTTAGTTQSPAYTTAAITTGRVFPSTASISTDAGGAQFTSRADMENLVRVVAQIYEDLKGYGLLR